MVQSNNTRRSRTVTRQMEKQIIFSIVGILIILFLVFKYGVAVIQGIGSVATSIQKPQQTQQSSENPSNVILRAPQLDNVPTATKDPTIKITGTVSDTTGVVQIFVNGNLAKTAPIQNDGTFTASSIPLSKGDNSIKANYKKGGKTSDFTPVYTVSYVDSAPTLQITFPSDKQQFTRGDQEITVLGKTDPNSTVTVNGFRAIVDNSGNFSYYLKLADGDNKISIEADNAAGLSTKQDITVSYHS